MGVPVLLRGEYVGYDGDATCWNKEVVRVFTQRNYRRA